MTANGTDDSAIVNFVHCKVLVIIAHWPKCIILSGRPV